jgi:hypothetical protein
LVRGGRRNALLLRLHVHALGQRTHRTGTNHHLQVLQTPNYRLVLARLNPLQRPYHIEDVGLLLVFLDGLLRRVVVLLVGQEDVV